jgi:hypothetical protein
LRLVPLTFQLAALQSRVTQDWKCNRELGQRQALAPRGVGVAQILLEVRHAGLGCQLVELRRSGIEGADRRHDRDEEQWRDRA